MISILESAAYILIYFLRDKLPWQSLHGGTEKHREDRVKEKKKTWSSSVLCEGLPKEFATYLDYTKGLEYDQEPDYEYMKDLFRSLLNQGGEVVEEIKPVPDRTTGALSPTTGGNCASEDLQLSPLESDDEETEYFSSESSPAPVTDEHSAPEHLEYFYPEPDPDDENAEQVSSGSHYDTVLRSSGASSPPASPPPVKKGDYVLVKLNAHPTLEYYEGWSADLSAETDNSYWHSLSLSRDEWHFPWRPALVLDVHAGHAYTPLFAPAHAPARRIGQHCPVTQVVSFPCQIKRKFRCGDRWRGDRAYPCVVARQNVLSDVFKVLVPTDRMCSVNVHWRLAKEKVAHLVAARDDALTAIYDNDVHLYDNEVTQDVKQMQGKKHFVEHYPIFGDVTSLTEDAFSQPDVDFLGSNGWLPEFNKIDRRHKGENCWHPDNGGDGDGDNESISMYTGPVPNNRRLSITLVIPADAIMDSSVIDSAET
ncbi:hypothetical protein DFH11DRAFT_1815959 [Phellopilus nigrolimitatus]|nr:hypothetical protein DFH11DRAFT_1815959 [Phellopilus nigrolimitatus]